MEPGVRPDHRDQITIRHLGPLEGTIRVPGAKNAVLKLMAASLLADGRVRAHQRAGDQRRGDHGRAARRPRRALAQPGAAARLVLDNDGHLVPVAPYELVERIRASINVLGPLLTRCGEVRLSMPGGDDFGARPIDMHVAGLEAMGASRSSSPTVSCMPRRTGCTAPTSPSRFPSVGATENIVTAAVFADGHDDDRQRRA